MEQVLEAYALPVALHKGYRGIGIEAGRRLIHRLRYDDAWEGVCETRDWISVHEIHGTVAVRMQLVTWN